MSDFDATYRPSAEGHTGDESARAQLQMANERTMLAWARTSIAIMALGFVVARFGFVLRELQPPASRPIPGGVSIAFGTALVGCGAVVVVLATGRYVRTGQAIERHAYHWSPGLVTVMSLLLVVVAALLAAYLLLTG